MSHYSKLLEELERSFMFFNEHFLNGKLPMPVITISPSGAHKNTLGWHQANSWSVMGEDTAWINICADKLTTGYEDVLGTLLHEMAHQLNSVEGIKGCNAAQYHNAKFAEAAERLGLITVKGNKGYAETHLGDAAMQAIAELKPNTDLYQVFYKSVEAVKKPPKKTVIVVSKETKTLVKQVSQAAQGNEETTVILAMKALAEQMGLPLDTESESSGCLACVT
jgi:hypothetical protein